jgi:anti-sigma B factor antagonist
VIALEGDLDLTSAPRLRWALFDLRDKGQRRVIVDLSPATFMDSTALGVLLSFKRTLGPDGVLAVAAPNPAILKLFEVTHVDQNLDVFPSVDAAIGDLERVPSDEASESAEAPKASAAAIAQPPADDEEIAAAEAAALTGDAALVLGIAATAMPFARSAHDQSEQWLRALREHGDAAIVLTALGIRDPQPGEPGEHPVGRPPKRGVVPELTRRAHRIAERRGATSIHTTDLLGAALEVYAEDFDDVLAEHGVDRAELVEQLRVSS